MSTTKDGLRTARYWRDRADEARARAEEMRNYEAEATMHDVARMYDRLADLATNRRPANKAKIQSD